MEHDFSNVWHKFITEENKAFVAELKEEHFPYFAQAARRSIVDKTLFKITADGKFDPEAGKNLNSTNMIIEICIDDLAETLPTYILIQ